MRRPALPAEAIVRHVVTFGRVLREAGIPVGAGRVADALTALDVLGINRQEDVYWALRATLVARQEDLELFDRAFDAWFLRAPVAAPRRPPPAVQRVGRSLGHTDSAPGGPEEARSEEVTLGGSTREVLRRRDFGTMSEQELAAARRLFGQLAAMRPRRRSRRLRSHPRGTVLDLRRVTRRSLATGGEPLERVYRRRRQVPRRLVLLCDISGSMQAYTRALLLFLHGAAAERHVEVFAFGTRLTRLTGALDTRDPDRALARAAETVVDWAGGTRIGPSLRAFNDRWGRRAVTRGAVVVIASDGWERGDPDLLGREMARLRRAAYAVVWVSPLKGDADYEPLSAGMRAALPHVDRFLAGHNIASLEELGSVLAGIERRHITRGENRWRLT